MVTKEMWVDWVKHPVTQEFLKALNDKREMLKEGLSENQTGTEREDCITMGKCQSLKDAIVYATKEFDYVEIENVAKGDFVPSDFEG